MRPSILYSIAFLFVFFSFGVVHAQVWVPDLGNGRYRNPVIHADYSDPDVIRVKGDYFLVSSSFNCMPGIPVLHSKDLINWKIVNHVYDSLPLEKYNKPVHGEGSWAPAIRYYNHTYFVYFCTPHDGLFMATTADPFGRWELHQVEKVELWEDPCPFWDEDGSAYLVRSRVCAGELYLHKMSKDGRKLLDNGIMIFKDSNQPTIEGPKLYKLRGYYYIFAPAGGVSKGWQTVLRSKNIYGPYEAKKVLHQGNTDINGPHQGALVDSESGNWWFMHFQDKDAFGRVVHLQPVNWEDDWPLIGLDINNDSIGEPVSEYSKPLAEMISEIIVPQTSDEFNGSQLGLQWQWHANPKNNWYSLNPKTGTIRLHAVKNITQNGNLWFVPNLLLQKVPAPVFSATTKIDFKADLNGEKAGLVVMGTEWQYLAMVKTENGIKLGMYSGTYERCEENNIELESVDLKGTVCYLKVFINEFEIGQFSYSTDNENFTPIGTGFQIKKGKWIGAKIGVFCINPNIVQSKGFADVDWFRVE
jgi:beta-xylosidase